MTMQRTKTLLLAVGLVVTVMSTGVWAAANPLEGQPAIRNKVQLFEARNLVAPMVGVTLGDVYEHNILAGISWRYFFVNWVGVGVDVLAGGSVETSLTRQINRELSGDAGTFELNTTHIQLLATACAEFVPFEGKALIFGAHTHVDFHVNLGAGIARVAGGDAIEDATSFVPMAGLGMRIFPTPWVAVGFDVRWQMIQRVLAMRRDGSTPPPAYRSHWLLGVSVVFAFPTTPEIAP